MKFFHVYNEECFKGLEKNGFLNKDSGFKIQHAFSVPEERKFNRMAVKEGKLYQILKEGAHPFYVDRLAGGVTYHKYHFDLDLIRVYEDLLGDWFLGFQLHESGNNIRTSDWRLIRKLMGGDGPYEEEKLRKAVASPFAKLQDGTVLELLSHEDSSWYAKRRWAETPAEFLDEMKEMFVRRMDEVSGHILPCDSFYLIAKIQDDLGMKSFMPEVGCQIPLMRLEVALNRGIAKASHKTWGVYYECWRWQKGAGYSMPCYNTDASNEWYLSQDIHPDDFTSYGAKGGSSRYLQNRIYYYALMSGADYFSEEWGLNCSYTDMKEFTLSEYGEMKKAFIHQAETLRGMKALVPFAIVLPRSYSCVDLFFGVESHQPGVHRGDYLDCPLSREDAEYYGHIEDVLSLFFGRNDDLYGNEGHVITNSMFADVFDVIYEDAKEETLQQYAYLIDATKNGDFARAKADSNLKVLESDDFEKLSLTIQKLIREEMPVYVDGLCWLVSEDNQKRRFLSIFNNEGNQRSNEEGDVLDPRADKRVTVTFKAPVELRVVKEAPKKIEILKKDEVTYQMEIPAAGFAVLEF